MISMRSGAGTGSLASMKVGLIGLGAIGRGVIQFLHTADDVELVGALVADPTKVRPLGTPSICSELEQLLEKRPEVIVELAGHAALRCYGPPVLRAGIDLIMLSVGALADPTVEQAITDAARAGGSRATVPSGGIG